MNKVFIIINPSAGDESGKDLGKALQSIYSDKGIETKIYETSGDDNYKELVKEAMSEGYETLIIAGGDGTISELVNGIAELERRPKIILIPAGTTNNFARSMGSELNKNQFLQAIKEEQLVEIQTDLGQLNDQYFISSFAVGVLPEVGWETGDDLKADLGPFAYLLEGMKAVTQEEQESFNLRLIQANEEVEETELFLFIVGLSNSIMGIQTFFEEATINDGELHYFGLKKAGVFSEATALLRQVFKKGRIEKNSELAFEGSFKQASIESDATFNLLVDGEKGPTFPVELGILHNHLTFLLPKK